jgi:hypothetical protein
MEDGMEVIGYVLIYDSTGSPTGQLAPVHAEVRREIAPVHPDEVRELYRRMLAGEALVGDADLVERVVAVLAPDEEIG